MEVEKKMRSGATISAPGVPEHIQSTGGIRGDAMPAPRKFRSVLIQRTLKQKSAGRVRTLRRGEVTGTAVQTRPA
jgi:hypothetical protein